MSCFGARRRYVPEVIQASAMDCGPAALKSVCEGFGVQLDYQRLREACQVQLDGTSIDTLERVAQQLGLNAEQALVPIDQLWSDSPPQLPALAVTWLPNNTTHFVVLWSQLAGRVQVMDPARGRRYVTRQQLERELYVHRYNVSAAEFRQYAGSPEFLVPLRARLSRLVDAGTRDALLAAASQDASWRSLSALDAAVRACSQLVGRAALRRGREAGRLLRRWFELGRADPAAVGGIPEPYWYASQASSSDAAEVTLSGAVILRFSSRDTGAQRALPLQPTAAGTFRAAEQASSERPFHWLSRLLRREGPGRLGLLAGAAALAALAGLFEAILWRGQLELDHLLGAPSQRSAAVLAALSFMALLGALELALARASLGVGRRLELRLRMAFLEKLPRLHDRYFQSRTVSDLADRSHMTHQVRGLPGFAIAVLRSVAGLCATAAGLVWLDPSSAPRVLFATLISLCLPLYLQRPLREHDGRLRAHAASLAGFYFDALSGSTMIRAHAGEGALRAEHEGRLGDWKRASLAFMRAGVGLELLVSLGAAAVSGWLFLSFLETSTEPAGALLYLYWALSFPDYGRALAGLMRQLPAHRNVLSRLLEPLDAQEQPLSAAGHAGPRAQPAQAVSIACRALEVQAGGHTLLTGVDLRISPGEHVAVVGASGAGKSTLLGLVLGFHRPSQGELTIDGLPLTAERLNGLRERTAWVDPAVHLWNQSLLHNLRYGSEPERQDIFAAISDSELEEVLAALPAGLQSPLGESGSKLSGGEGQRVRFARALGHTRADLALLDEPFRGLDRPARARLLARARSHFRHATLLCVTHDVSETRAFGRVLVLDQGRIVEDGAPALLAARSDSRYAALLRAEAELDRSLHSDREWRRLWLQDGRLHAADACEPAELELGAAQ